MKPRECLFLSRHTAIGRGGIDKVLEYLTDSLLATFSHTYKTMADCDMLSFLCSVLQIYLEFWNSSDPFEEYVPDFMKPSRCVQDECAHIIIETASLLTHIRSCQYLRSINTVETRKSSCINARDILPAV